jgi:hypothetical protein
MSTTAPAAAPAWSTSQLLRAFATAFTEYEDEEGGGVVLSPLGTTYAQNDVTISGFAGTRANLFRRYLPANFPTTPTWSVLIHIAATTPRWVQRQLDDAMGAMATARTEEFMQRQLMDEEEDEEPHDGFLGMDVADYALSHFHFTELATAGLDWDLLQRALPNAWLEYVFSHIDIDYEGISLWTDYAEFQVELDNARDEAHRAAIIAEGIDSEHATDYEFFSAESADRGFFKRGFLRLVNCIQSPILFRRCLTLAARRGCVNWGRVRVGDAGSHMNCFTVQQFMAFCGNTSGIRWVKSNIISTDEWDDLGKEGAVEREMVRSTRMAITGGARLHTLNQAERDAERETQSIADIEDTDDREVLDASVLPLGGMTLEEAGASAGTAYRVAVCLAYVYAIWVFHRRGDTEAERVQRVLDVLALVPRDHSAPVGVAGTVNQLMVDFLLTTVHMTPDCQNTLDALSIRLRDAYNATAADIASSADSFVLQFKSRLLASPVFASRPLVARAVQNGRQQRTQAFAPLADRTVKMGPVGMQEKFRMSEAVVNLIADFAGLPLLPTAGNKRQKLHA